jgi:hypothetical protein
MAPTIWSLIALRALVAPAAITISPGSYIAEGSTAKLF